MRAHAAAQAEPTAAEAARGGEEDEESDTLGELKGAATHRGVAPARAPSTYQPVPSDDCFASALEVDIPLSDPAGGAETDVATMRTYFSPPASAPGGFLAGRTVFVCHHGAGFSALSFALMAREITRRTGGEVGVLAYDCRGHGRSRFPSAAVRDMSLDALRDDLIGLVTTLFPMRAERPRLVLVGHSMGGAVVVAAAHALQARQAADLAGVAMIDIVEGTSLRLLPEMVHIVRRRPEAFVSVPSAIQWHVESGTIRNVESARRSVPPLVREKAETRGLPWHWVCNLLATEPFWKGWFTGLSRAFLTTKTARLLILAESENLDQELTIGQMQGKYQLVISPDAGHCVQEDMPVDTAKTLVHFWRRNEVLPAGVPGIRKVGEV
ncbi:protein phosphatase methylesterase-1 [Malassezia sp. CBS 17886]|nr:protein phosphatase methylesterase-1 [Malassezia sp. CBS 17886]